MNNSQDHLPVMLREVLQYMQPKDNELYIDCTFGAGGYTRGMLEVANCKVIAVDRDASVQKYADNLKVEFNERFEFHNIKYSDFQRTDILSDRPIFINNKNIFLF